MSKVLLVTGPSGAGKSTTCAQFAATAEGTWAYINQDDIRDLVKSGFASANDYYQNWTPETKNQWAASIPICCDMIKRYHEFGINVIVDLFAPPSEYEKWQTQLDGLSHRLIMLLPDVETTVRRNAQRTGTSRLKETKIRQNHEWFTD